MTVRSLGIGIVLQAAAFVVVSVVTLPVALRVAEILYAEDFVLSAVPWWFGPWFLAMFHPDFATVVFLVPGATLIIAGLRFTKHGLAARRWLERSLILVTICCLVLAAALTPLSSMGSDWANGTPAHDLRQTLIASTAAVWLELVVLLATTVIVFRIRE